MARLLKELRFREDGFRRGRSRPKSVPEVSCCPEELAGEEPGSRAVIRR